jgi:glycosyltransferase involved in cell wall biosynthesis
MCFGWITFLLHRMRMFERPPEAHCYFRIMYSLAITTMNRYELTVKSFEKVLHDDRISEIIILDDASTDGSFEKLTTALAGENKVRVIGRLKNAGMSRAKFEAIGYSKEPFAIILDSDNEISTEYIDALDGLELDDKTIYMPEWARPTFDYRAYAGLTFDRTNIKEYLDKPMFEALLNTSNYVVPVAEYCKIYKEDPTVKGSDTVYFAHLWLAAGNKFHVVKGLQYDHLQHSESGWLKDASYNMVRGRQTIEQIKNL